MSRQHEPHRPAYRAARRRHAANDKLGWQGTVYEPPRLRPWRYVGAVLLVIALLVASVFAGLGLAYLYVTHR